MTSSCNGDTTKCIAFGPGRDMFESMEIIAQKQYQAALDCQKNISDFLHGSVTYRHAFVNMANRSVQLENGTTVKTCKAALGYGFLAGTTDGPGA